MKVTRPRLTCMDHGLYEESHVRAAEAQVDRAHRELRDAELALAAAKGNVQRVERDYLDLLHNIGGVEVLSTCS